MQRVFNVYLKKREKSAMLWNLTVMSRAFKFQPIVVSELVDSVWKYLESSRGHDSSAKEKCPYWYDSS